MSDKDNDDWHDDSATLFRSTRRAHDPTPADRAAIDRVLTRIQDVAPTSATAGSGQASHAATAAKWVQIAKVSLAVLGVAAAYFAFGRAEHDASAPAASAPAAAIASAASPPPVARLSLSDEAPRAPSTPASSAEPNGLPPTPVARREDESPIRAMPRRLRPSTGSSRPSQTEDAVVAEAPSSTPERFASAADTLQQRSTTSAVAAAREPVRRESSLESNVQAAVAPATDPAVVAPQDASTELAVLKRMQAALRAADFTTTLALCAEHERRWPHGTFELEREGVHVIAACGVSSDDAAPRAKAFLAEHPHAAIALRVSSACKVQLQGR